MVLRYQVPTFRGLNPEIFRLPVILVTSGIQRRVYDFGLKLHLMRLDRLFYVSLQRNQFLVLFRWLYRHLLSCLARVQAISKHL